MKAWKNYFTSCITTIGFGCVAHLYDINTDEHIANFLIAHKRSGERCIISIHQTLLQNKTGYSNMLNRITAVQVCDATKMIVVMQLVT